MEIRQALKHDLICVRLSCLVCTQCTTMYYTSFPVLSSLLLAAHQKHMDLLWWVTWGSLARLGTSTGLSWGALVNPSTWVKSYSVEMAGTSYDSLRLSMTPHSVTDGRLLSWLPARRAGRGVTIVIAIVVLGGRAGVSHEGEVDSRWGSVHNYPTLMNTMLCSYLILYTWYIRYSVWASAICWFCIRQLLCPLSLT